MFEYLMPLLIMPNYENTLLGQTYKAVVKKQIDYGKKRGVPWGISESCFNMTDVQLNYQYRSFGVPGLGFKRELANDLVIAPYASVMALMIAPEKAYENLDRMTKGGFQGRYGFYEAIDYTPSRLTHEQKNALIKSFMTHHQGMSFLSLAYLLLDQPMQRRLKAEPLFQATELLLQERLPKTAFIHPRSTEISQVARIFEERAVSFRVFDNPDTPIPEVHILSNGRYHVMVTNSGGGYSRWKDIALTRWREDTTRDNWGMFCYIRDVASGDVWSVAYQPTLKEPDGYEVIFTQGRAEFRRRDNNLDTHMEITVSPEDDIELRRISILNRSSSKRTIELTTYGEVVIAAPDADATHPAFNNMFVQTQIIREHNSVLATRRPRSKSDPAYWMLHMMTVHGKTIGITSYETDRSKFIGRARNPANPVAMDNSFRLSDSEGSVLDPVVSIRRRITIDSEETVVVNIVSGISETRAGAIKLIEKYKDRRINDRVFAMAATHGQVVLSQIKATENDAQLYGRLASSIIYSNPQKRANPGILTANRRGQSGLWGYGISGDLPIVLLKIGNPSKIELVQQLVRAHAYWRIKGLPVDLVICNEDYSSYRQALQDKILSVINTSTEAKMIDQHGGIFVKQGEQIPAEDKILIHSVARFIVTDSDSAGGLSEYVERRRHLRSNIPQLIPIESHRPPVRGGSNGLTQNKISEKSNRELEFFNGMGGFTKDGREYVISTMPGQATPAPWLNVLANQNFGTIVTESGGSYTWCENAHQFRLTPWYNDPVCDTSGEALYIRDENSGKFWSPTPLPAPGLTPYTTRHGFGYSVFEHNEDGIVSELWIYVAVDSPVKFFTLKIRNKSGRSRRISVTGYFEWLLGELRHKEAMHVITEIDHDSGALFAQNFYNTDFAGRVVFLDATIGLLNENETTRNFTADRNEFLGRNGSLSAPNAMKKVRLSGKTGAGIDPCGAMQVSFDLADEDSKEIVFTMGVGKNIKDARNLVSRFRGVEPARHALEAVWDYWNRTLGVIYLETPDQSVNMLANGWLLYQILSCRIWARSGYYQSGGAFGFRDQLQDIMALVYAEPSIIRKHILSCAAHQFPEGDVQHWWHPPSGNGVRTHCSDDYLWLPFAVHRYIDCTGDIGILDECVNFIVDRSVSPNEDAYYGYPTRSEESAALYEHCIRAIKYGLKFGRHGLPLIGSGDWNDSFNLIGAQGKGESVWLGFFLYTVLIKFSELAKNRDDIDFAEYCTSEAMRLRRNIDENAWDGEWYKRAYFDNGEPLGSADNSECRIDSIPQSWAVLSGAGDPKRAQAAMEAVNKYLVRRDKSLIQLFDPPFDKSDSDPGYVKGYIPGIRENGGQYTHAAVWAIMAFAALGNNRRAWELLSLINPITHADTPEKVLTYKVEPYVVAADIYSVEPHLGRGGWTWYTGAAGWMYRLIIESLLGINLKLNKLSFTPCLPVTWKSFKIHYRYHETFYHIVFTQTGNGRNAVKVVLDGIEQNDLSITLNDDRKDHSAEVEVD
jgi:cellobiose phosphorylase